MWVKAHYNACHTATFPLVNTSSGRNGRNGTGVGVGGGEQGKHVHSRRWVFTDLILANQEKLQFWFWPPEHVAFSLLGSRDKVTLAMKGPPLPWRKRCSPRQMRGQGSPPGVTTARVNSSPDNREQPVSRSSHDYLQTTFFSKHSRPKEQEKTETCLSRAEHWRSDSRWTAPDKLYR